MHVPKRKFFLISELLSQYLSNLCKIELIPRFWWRIKFFQKLDVHRTKMSSNLDG